MATLHPLLGHFLLGCILLAWPPAIALHPVPGRTPAGPRQDKRASCVADRTLYKPHCCVLVVTPSQGPGWYHWALRAVQRGVVGIECPC